MLLATTSQQRVFYRKNGFIAFEDVVTDQLVDTVYQKSRELLAKRMHCELESLPEQDTHKLFMQGRDLWREDPLIEKISLKRAYAEVASDLFSISPVRIAYDHYLCPGKEPLILSHSLKARSSLQNVIGGFFITLCDIGPHPMLPSKKGGILFISPFLEMNMEVQFPLLQVVYCREQTRYFPNSEDPLSGHPRKLGYHSGELLVNKTHPIVWSVN